MMEHTGLIDIIEEKIKRFSSGEYLLGSEIKDILLSEEFVIGPLEDEILGEVYEFIYFKNEGVPERYPCDLYKSKLDYILKINKKGVAAYEHKKNKKTFMDYLYFCLKSMKDIDIAAREWSKLQKIYIRDTENKEIEDKLKDFRDIYRELVEYNNNTDWSEGIPEDYLGVPMDAEWILTGQDSDTNGGYKAIYYDEETGYVILKSRNIYSTYVKMVNINGNWYVDGAGYVNTYDFPDEYK